MVGVGGGVGQYRHLIGVRDAAVHLALVLTERLRRAVAGISGMTPLARTTKPASVGWSSPPPIVSRSLRRPIGSTAKSRRPGSGRDHQSTGPERSEPRPTPS
ncbi:hypothetical protein [Actinokineospora diospyrosa]|uniref:Uncharacterized protein n=1 Tax=Actinokineospora diospyrosa TaxID=103728 RepID=A0ABT1IML4_9PSEU|nr:hypothetical protein [Actinokineospora diospyrosa]MCP2273912.1 hypothetical protein [Actinokineospora diospyrosa]